MHLLSVLLLTSAASAAAPVAHPKREDSTDWKYYRDGQGMPGSFMAFDFGGCSAQLTLTKWPYLGVEFTFEAVYSDGIRIEHIPFRNQSNFGVTDPVEDDRVENNLFTAVHEFSDVCNNGAAPVAWLFFAKLRLDRPGGTTYDSAPNPVQEDYRFTSGEIPVMGGVSRPSEISGVSFVRINKNGDFQVDWSPVSEAAAYSAIVRYPQGQSEGGISYRVTTRARTEIDSTTAIFHTGTQAQFDPRSVIVHAINSDGVWS